MRKELIIAIISGIIIGVIVAFGFWRANSALKPESTTSSQDNPTTESKDKPLEQTQITLAQPEEDDVITQSPVLVSGIAKPDTTLIISSENEDYIVTTSSDGSFEQEVELVGGVNDILFAYSDNENSVQNKNLRIIYSTEFEEETSEQ
jgi:hypothetical protein